MKFKQMLFGQPMPDANDPKYKARRERDLKAGVAFARKLKIDKAATFLQCVANRHPKRFLTVVFGIIILSWMYRAVGMAIYYVHQQEHKTVIQSIDERMLQKGMITNQKIKDTTHVQAN